MTEIEQERARAVAEAETWLGTPYHHRAAVKGVGADCALFPLAVYRAAVPHRMGPVTVPSYPRDWHLHKDRGLYREIVSAVAREIDEAAAQPGDFVLYRFGRVESHGAILIRPGLLIHSYVEVGVVYQEADADWLAARKASFWTVWP